METLIKAIMIIGILMVMFFISMDYQNGLVDLNNFIFFIVFLMILLSVAVYLFI